MSQSPTTIKRDNSAVVNVLAVQTLQTGYLPCYMRALLITNYSFGSKAFINKIS